MLPPKKIEIEAMKKENENMKFRTYLKNHADEEKLDEQFARLHKDLFGIDYQTKHKPCDFLLEDGNCKLGDCKPESCKKYPYTDQPDRIGSLLGMLDIVKICPVAFEIFERLKKEYGFKARR